MLAANPIGFNSDWLRKWREIFQRFLTYSNAKPKQSESYFLNPAEYGSISNSRTGLVTIIRYSVSKHQHLELCRLYLMLSLAMSLSDIKTLITGLKV